MRLSELTVRFFFSAGQKSRCGKTYSRVSFAEAEPRARLTSPSALLRPWAPMRSSKSVKATTRAPATGVPPLRETMRKRIFGALFVALALISTYGRGATAGLKKARGTRRSPGWRARRVERADGDISTSLAPYSFTESSRRSTTPGAAASNGGLLGPWRIVSLRRNLPVAAWVDRAGTRIPCVGSTMYCLSSGAAMRPPPVGRVCPSASGHYRGAARPRQGGGRPRRSRPRRGRPPQTSAELSPSRVANLRRGLYLE